MAIPRKIALFCLPALLAPGALPASADTPYAAAFVDAFAEACVPGRLTYGASLDAARAAGWSEIAPDAHPELAAILALSEKEALETDLEDASFAFTAFERPLAGNAHHLVVSRVSAVITDPEDPFVYVGCHLYNFDAVEPLDPEPVSALIGNPISATRRAEGVESHVWGPPCPMPRTSDTYLSFVAEGSPITETVPFTGVALNFSTSELAEGEPVPDPYC